MDLERIEWLHDHGYMPVWVYYQQNGKSAQANWEEQHRKIYERIKMREEEQARQKQIEAEIEAEIEKQLPDVLEKALDDILKGFNFK